MTDAQGFDALASLSSNPEAAAPAEPKIDAQGRAYATGKRKNAVARVRMKLSTGNVLVYGKPKNESFAREVAGELLGENAVLRMPSPVMGAEDFSYVLNRTPGAMMLLGVRPPGEKDPAPCHSSRMMLDEEAMPVGAALHAAVATRFLAA